MSWTGMKIVAIKMTELVQVALWPKLWSPT
jgi:hypothetical protein